MEPILAGIADNSWIFALVSSAVMVSFWVVGMVRLSRSLYLSGVPTSGPLSWGPTGTSGTFLPTQLLGLLGSSGP